MNDEIKEILEFKENADYKRLSCDEIKVLRDYIINLEEEKDKYKTRCYNALKMIWDKYGVLDKYGIEMLEDILEGKEDE